MSWKSTAAIVFCLVTVQFAPGDSADSAMAKPTSLGINITTSMLYVPDGKAGTAHTQVMLNPVPEDDSEVTVTASADSDGITLDFDGEKNATTVLKKSKISAALNIASDGSLLPRTYIIVVEATAAGHKAVRRDVKLVVGDPFFSAVFGIGSLIGGPNATNYKVQNDTLVATALGRATPELLVGGSFTTRVPRPRGWKLGEPYPWSAYVSLRFTPGSDQTIAGYVFGGSYRFTHYLDALVGYSLSPREEPTVAFRNAAIQLVMNNPNVPIYQRYNVDDMRHNRANAFDGFPLVTQSVAGPTGQRVIATDPTVTHYRGGFFIGLAIPISLRARLGK